MNRLPPKVGKREINVNVLLVDGNALFKVGFHGAKDEYTTHSEHGESVHVGGLVQFIRILRNFLFDNYFNKVYVFWDGKYSGKLRYEIYPEYKESRGKDYINGNIPEESVMFQMYQVQEYLEDLSVRQLQHSIIEGDDLIAYYCINHPATEKITIMTNDRDLCQLISDDVRVYLLDKKSFITKENYKDNFKIHLDNALLVKIICGDDSDCIKGIKGVGVKTLLKYFPELAHRKLSVDDIKLKAIEVQVERLKLRKKPVMALNNIIEAITEGSQGVNIYEINKVLMDLKTPMITPDVLDEIDALMENAIVVDDKGIKNVYGKMKRDGISYLLNENYIADFLMPYKKIIERERKLLNNTEKQIV